MKKIFSAFFATLLFTAISFNNAYAGGGCTACNIDTTGCTGLFGAICPDSLPAGNVGVFYDESVTFYLPAQIVLTEFVLPQPITIPIVNITLDTIKFANSTTLYLFEASLDTVIGLPVGLNWECNLAPNSCEYFPVQGNSASQYGCAKICGFPCSPQDTTPVIFNFTYLLDIRGVDTLQFAPPLDQIFGLLAGFGINPSDFLPDTVALPFPQAAFFEMATGYDILEIANTAGTSYLCPSGAGSSITLDASGYSIYDWSTGDNTASIAATAAGTYSLTVEDANGCVQTDSVELFLLEANAGTDSTVCASQILQLIGSGGDSFSWTPTSNLSDDTVNNPVVFNLASTTEFVLTVGNGTCTSNDTVAVIIDNINCDGPCTGKCLLNKTGCSGVDPKVCQAALPQLTLGTNYDESFTFYVPETISSQLLIQNADIPDINIPGLGNLTDFIGFLPAMQVPVDQITITVTGLPVGVNWECDQIGGNCTYYPSLYPAETQWGCIKLCGNGVCDQARDYTVTVLATIAFNLPIPVPVPGFDNFEASIPMTINLPVRSVSGFLTITPSGTTTINAGESVQLAATSGYASYQWSSGETTATITASNFGNYSVTAVDGNGCDQVATIGVFNAVGINEINILENSLVVYPNPNSGNFDVAFELQNIQVVTVEIFTLQGQRILSRVENGSFGKNIFPVSLKNLSKGTYFLKLSTAEGSVNKRIAVY